MSEESYKETIETIGKGIDFAQKTGRFIAPLIKGTLEQGIGIFQDKLSYIRWERLNRFIEKSNDKMMQLGIDEIQTPVPLKFMIPLLQGATLEEDDDLQDIWVNLLVNSICNEGIELKRVYIDILERLSPLEAKILNAVYCIPFEANRNNTLLTYKLPDEVEIEKPGNMPNPKLENADVELALANLARIGCIVMNRTAGGGEFFSSINMTLLGTKFYEVCNLKKETK